jgi:hypothetical protein
MKIKNKKKVEVISVNILEKNVQKDQKYLKLKSINVV